MLWRFRVVGTLNPALYYILLGSSEGLASLQYRLYHREGEMGDTGGDKSLSASPWVSNHTRGHRESVFEALPLLFQGPALWPLYKSAYTHILGLEEHLVML